PGRNIEKEAAILNTSVLLKYHVTTVLVSYGLISLGFVVSLFYLGTHYFGRTSVSTVGAVEGGDMAAAAREDHSWGRWWAFDPKETWALLTWIIYLVVIHLRLATSRHRALVTAWLSVAG